MFYVKNDDMEDMMKKAADNYELNEDMAADWNKVRAALQNEDAFITSAYKEKKRRKLFLFWWLLLIPAIAILTYKTGLYNSDKEQNSKTIITKKQNNTTQNNSSENKKTINTSNILADLNTNNKKVFGLNSSKKITTDNKSISANIQSPLSTNKTSKANFNTFSNANTNKNILNTQAFGQTGITDNNSVQPANNNLPKNILTNDQLNKSTDILNNKANLIQKDNKADITQTNTSTPVAANAAQKKKTDNYTRQAFAYAGFTGNARSKFCKISKNIFARCWYRFIWRLSFKEWH